jgi:hypothetical protein
MVVSDMIVYPQSNASNFASTNAATDHSVSVNNSKSSISKEKAIKQKAGRKDMDRLEKTNSSCK